MWETWIRSLGWEDPLEKEMATRSSTLAWKIPWTKKSGRLKSMGSQRVRHDWETSISLSLFQCCIRGLLGCLHFFTSFLKYSVLQHWFPAFCLLGHLSILLPQSLCYWLYIVHLCLFFTSSRSLVTLCCIFSNLCLHSFFEILNHIHYHYFKFFFW